MLINCFRLRFGIWAFIEPISTSRGWFVGEVTINQHNDQSLTEEEKKEMTLLENKLIGRSFDEVVSIASKYFEERG